tara:strand:+ start:30 stop:233 length:204 start_codon:yes stop_codon:yes gene_type:complete
LRCGDLVVVVTGHVHVTVVTTMQVQVEDTTTLKPSLFKEVGHIPSVLLAFIVAVRGIVLVVEDVLPM